MLKSRLLAGGAFTLALTCVIPIGLALARQSDADLLKAYAQDKSDAVGVHAIDLEYAVALSGDTECASGTALNYATTSDLVSLPSNREAPTDQGSDAIDLNDPAVQRQWKEAAAEAEQSELQNTPVSGGFDYSDGFVFDINKTIFPVTEEEVEMLKYVVEAEGGGGSLEDKRLVTFSITNRVLSPNFPDTLYKVLHSVNQFSTIENYYSKRKVPSESTCRAVEEVLMGVCEDNSKNALYFYCTNYPVEDWIVDWFENDLVYLYTVGCDRFFTDPS